MKERAKIAQLVPGSRIHDNHDVCISPGVAGFRENLNPLFRIQEAIARGERAGQDQADLFAHLLERFAKAEDGTDAVAVGPDVRRQQKALVTVNQIHERRPINRHAFFLFHERSRPILQHITKLPKSQRLRKFCWRMTGYHLDHWPFLR